MHALSASILKAIKIALFIQEYYYGISFEIETSSEPTIIDIENSENVALKAVYTYIKY